MEWHLGSPIYSQPQNQGFDEFYGIPPNDTWDAFGMIRQGHLAFLSRPQFA